LSRVCDLIPGQRVTGFGQSAIFVARTDHPLYPGLQLVIWRMEGGGWPDTEAGWSLDPLDARQEVGEAQASTAEERTANLRAAILGEAAR
jgi:hypothetical protein